MRLKNEKSNLVDCQSNAVLLHSFRKNDGETVWLYEAAPGLSAGGGIFI
jgi:hypothetical protein